jgi:UDP-galactose-lipid carrier transferase
VRYFLFRLTLFIILLFINLLVSFPLSDIFIDMEKTPMSLNYLWFIPFYLYGYYSYQLLSHRMVTTNEVILILKANFFALVAILFVIALTKFDNNTPRSIIIVYFILNNFNAFWSYIIKKYVFRFAYFRKPVFVICDSNGLKNMQSWFSKGNPFGYDVEKILNTDNQAPEVIYEQIDALIDTEHYDSAIIDLEDDILFNLPTLVDHVQRRIHKVIVLPKMSKLSIINGELISSLHHKGMAFFIKNNLFSPWDRTLKYLMGLFLSIVLIILFFPLLLTLYIMVYIATKGHPIFSHERIGFRGEKFRIYKFRTMHLDAKKRLQELLKSSKVSRIEWERDFKLKNDPRITKIGHFLRKTSLDELPQLINVLKGEMSLVGPRPIVEQEVQKYGEYFEYFTAVKPGITGLWQVSGRNDIGYNDRVQLDVWYVRNWSIELDIQILIKTVLVVLGRKGSY